LEDNQLGGSRLELKKSRRELFHRIFALGIFWDGVSRYAATPLIVALSPGRSDTTSFLPWSPVAIGNHLDCAEKIPLTLLVRVHAFRDPLRGELPHVQIFMNDGPNPIT